jgi:carboxylesterase
VGAGDPFDFVGDDDVGVICVHGFTGSPYEMRYLGAALARTGATVRGPLLPGHGTSPGDLEGTRWQDWAAAVEREVDTMHRRCRRVAVVGQSLGGLLALHLAARRPGLAAVAALATPLWLGGLAGHVARWLTGPSGGRIHQAVRQRVRMIPKLGGSDVRDRRVRAENPCYDRIPVRALGELLDFMEITHTVLPQIAPPVLVVHARRDHTAPVACAARIAELARARRVHILPRSFHLIANDVERDIVAAEVIAFLGRHAASQPGDLPCVT